MPDVLRFWSFEAYQTRFVEGCRGEPQFRAGPLPCKARPEQKIDAAVALRSLDVIGQIGKPDLHLCPGDPDGANPRAPSVPSGGRRHAQSSRAPLTCRHWLVGCALPSALRPLAMAARQQAAFGQQRLVLGPSDRSVGPNVTGGI